MVDLHCYSYYRWWTMDWLFGDWWPAWCSVFDFEKGFDKVPHTRL